MTSSGSAVAGTRRRPRRAPSWERAPLGVRLALWALLVGWVVFALSTVARPVPGPNTLLDSYLYNGLGLLATALVALRGWTALPAERAAWLLLAAGMGLSATGDVIWAFVIDGQDIPDVSVYDAFYVAFYPLAYAAVVVLLRTQLRRIAAALVLDGLTVGLALAAGAAAVAFGPVSAATGGSVTEIVVGLTYPIGDLVLISIVGAALALVGWRVDRRWIAVATGFVLFAVADTVYLFQSAGDTYAEGSWVDALWPAAGVLVTLAAWRPAAPLVRRPTRPVAVLVPPLACTVLAIAVLVTDHTLRLPAVAVALAAATLLLVAARLAITFTTISGLGRDQHRLAVTDELTGLPNRRALLAALVESAVRTAPGAQPAASAPVDRPSDPPSGAGPVPGADPGPGPVAGAAAPLAGQALLLVDLNRFKEINDSLGHHVGDELLRQLAERLRRSIRPGDLLARLGGDEFAVLLDPGTLLAEAERVAGRLVDGLTEPFQLAGITLTVEASVGIARCPEHCPAPDQLLQRADVAMYEAKAARRHVATYRASEDANGPERLQVVEEFRTALGNGELTCHYQPKVTLLDGTVASVEALVRWQHPTRGLLPPDEFLPMAERTGLMRPLTAVVLDLALTQAARWRAAGTPLTVAVNLSVSNLLDVDLPSDVSRLLAVHDLPPSSLMLEITESVLMADSVRARLVVDDLHALGVGLSIDDYGTGFSSLAYLQELAVDELKLDRVFVSRLADDPRSAAIVRSTVELAHSLGLRLVAEGVEDTVTLETLRSFGCDLSQGFHHSRPLPAGDLDRWLARQPDASCRPRSVQPDLPLAAPA